MLVPVNSSYMSVEEYFRLENRSSIRHEYIDGLVYAMTGSNNRHRRILNNIWLPLQLQLKGTGCRADTNEARVEVRATNSYYYPDIVVSCSEQDPDSIVFENPVVIVEILSALTARIDRREKLFAYRRIDSVLQYVIVHQRQRRVEVHLRDPDASWQYSDLRNGILDLNCLAGGQFKLSFDDIYEGIDFRVQVKEECAEYSCGSRNEFADPDFELECEGEDDDLDY